MSLYVDGQLSATVADTDHKAGGEEAYLMASQATAMALSEYEFFHVWDRALDADEFAALWVNPYRLLQPIIRHIPVAFATTPTPGVTVTLTNDLGLSPDADEAAIRAGAVSWRLNIAGGSWTAFNDTIKTDIINGLEDISSAGNDTEFEKVRANMRPVPSFWVGDPAGDVVAVVLPATPDYDITTPGEIQVTVPSSAYEPTP
jgi:hypothetical protein